MSKLLALLPTLFATVAVAQQPMQTQLAASSPERLQAAQVIGRIGNEVILASDVLWEVNLIIADNIDRIPPEQLEEARESIMQNQLRSYIDTKLLYADFRRNAQGADMAAIRKQLEEPFFSGGGSGDAPGTVPGLMKSLQVNSGEALEKKLMELGTSTTARMDAYVEKAIASQWMREKIKVDKPDHIELVEYYQDHLEDYSFPTQVKWEELKVNFTDEASKQGARAKLAEAGNIAWQRVQQNPAPGTQLFVDLAPKYSDAYNANDGGLHDWTSQGALRDTTLDTALFTLPVGALGPMLETDNALHIVRVVERREAGATPFRELQDEIRGKIMDESYQSQMRELIGKLRRETRIWTMYTGDTTAEAFLKSSAGPARR